MTRIAARRLSLRVLIWLLFAAFACACQAQPASLATVSGTATDASGAVLPGVAVHFTGPAPGSDTQSTVTNFEGSYRIPELAPGRYPATFELAGFQTVIRTVDLTPPSAIRVDAQMFYG